MVDILHERLACFQVNSGNRQWQHMTRVDPPSLQLIFVWCLPSVIDMAIYPAGDGRPVPLGDIVDEIAPACVLADGDGEADIHFAADGDESAGIAAGVGALRELPTVSRRK